ncbi:ATP-binding cassette domain-containing protein [Paenibacillus sp. HW567]|uniref:ATP-binding cassette domain-containing protein n=1 Tax=Paenibacillus sp. HW567 TaxID=1034769 RepID=UPI00036D4D6A|nr:ATP-binding cassette domain-containing protein [Paenibacillus sp. HW567]
MDTTTLILKYLNKNRFKILVLFLSTLVSSSLSSLLLPYFNGLYFDNLTGSIKLENVAKILIILLAVNFISLLVSYMVSIFHNTMNTRLAFDINFDLIDHIQKVPIEYSRQFNSSFLTEQLNSDSNVVSSYFLNLITQGITSLIVLLTTLYLLWKINIAVFLIFLLTIPIYICLYLIFKKPIYKSSLELKNGQSQLFADMYRQLNDISSIKINSLFQPLRKDIIFSFNKFMNSLVKNVKILSFAGTTNSFFINVCNLIILFVGAVGVAKGNITIGKLIIISSYLGTAIGSLQFFIDTSKNYQSVKASLDRLLNHINTPKEENGEIVLESIESISLRNITLAFNGQSIFKNFNVDFNKGKVYAITGKNGRGKTSLINLLSGLYHQYEGQISYNNIPLRELDMYEIRRRIFGVAEQNSLVIQQGFIGNLLYGVSEWNEDNLKELMKGFNFNDRIDLDNPNQTFMNLSGGEAQKSSIIRALLKEPEVLILDEPTSMMDRIGFEFFVSILHSIKEHKIILLITHDDDIKMICDKILNLDVAEFVEMNETEVISI